MPNWKSQLDNHRNNQTQIISKWFADEQRKIIHAHNIKLGQHPQGMKDEEVAWLRSWRERNEPAHKELLTELKPKYLLEHQTKMQKHKE